MKTGDEDIPAMSHNPDLPDSEAKDLEQADSYDRWFASKVRDAMDSGLAMITHAEVVARLSALLAEKRALRMRQGLALDRAGRGHTHVALNGSPALTAGDDGWGGGVR